MRALDAAAIAAAFLMLAACQPATTAYTPTYTPAPAAAPQPVVMPAPAAAPIGTGNSRTKTSTWTSPDGTRTVTRSTTTSSGVSFDPNAMLAAFGAQAAAAPSTTATPSAYFGTWQITDGQSGRTCSVDLNSTASGGTYGAWTRLCSSSELFGVHKWQLRGYDVVLLDLMGQPKATLRATAPNRLDGATSGNGMRLTMWR